jgi:hypothetical protein
MVKANWWRPIPALVLLLIAVMLSAAAGTPSELPGVALGWPLLLHLERAVVLVAGLGLVVLVGARATMGQFPFRLGQIEYAMEQMTAELDGTAQAQDELLDALEATTESSGVGRDVKQQI